MGSLEQAIKDLLEHSTYGLSALKDLITIIDTVVDAILVDTSTTLEDKIDTIDTIVDAILVDTGTTLEDLINNIVDKDSAPTTKAYPENADGVNVTSSTSDWAFGSWVEIIPANTITETFWIFGAVENTLSLAIDGILQIGIGGAGSEVAIMDIKFAHTFHIHTRTNQPMVKVAANTRVAARVATEGTSAKTLEISIEYATGL